MPYHRIKITDSEGKIHFDKEITIVSNTGGLSVDFETPGVGKVKVNSRIESLNWHLTASGVNYSHSQAEISFYDGRYKSLGGGSGEDHQSKSLESLARAVVATPCLDTLDALDRLLRAQKPQIQASQNQPQNQSGWTPLSCGKDGCMKSWSGPPWDDTFKDPEESSYGKHLHEKHVKPFHTDFASAISEVMVVTSWSAKGAETFVDKCAVLDGINGLVILDSEKPWPTITCGDSGCTAWHGPGYAASASVWSDNWNDPASTYGQHLHHFHVRPYLKGEKEPSGGYGAIKEVQAVTKWSVGDSGIFVIACAKLDGQELADSDLAPPDQFTKCGNGTCENAQTNAQLVWSSTWADKHFDGGLSVHLYEKHILPFLDGQVLGPAKAIKEVQRVTKWGQSLAAKFVNKWLDKQVGEKKFEKAEGE